MALSIFISNAEISPQPDQGRVLGDASPSVDQDGVMSKVAKSHDELKADLEALAEIFDPHDHDPDNSTGPGGPQIGALDDGEEVHAIADAAITEDLIDDLAITGEKTASGAIGTDEIDDEAIDFDKLGAPTSISRSIAARDSWTYTHGKGQYLLCHVECDHVDGWNIKRGSEDDSSITIHNEYDLALTATIVYWG